MFAAEHFDVRPDILTTAKGLGGSGAQVAAIVTDERMSGLSSDHHSFTYGGNVLAAAAAATLDVIARPGFLVNVRDVGAHIMGRLRQLAVTHPCIVDVRGLGLMIGIEIGDDDGRPNSSRAQALAARGMSHGLILRTSRYGRGNVVKIRPPLVITRAEADLLCDRLEALMPTSETGCSATTPHCCPSSSGRARAGAPPVPVRHRRGRLPRRESGSRHHRRIRQVTRGHGADGSEHRQPALLRSGLDARTPPGTA